MGKQPGSQAKLKKNVLDRNLCTGCGACVNLCPYQVVYHDRTVQLFECDLPDGKCHAFCPRTPADYRSIRERLYHPGDLTLEIGPVKEYLLTRASDPGLRARSQHGGTVTSLLELAMAEGLIDVAIVSGKNESHEQEGLPVENVRDIRSHAQSRFTVSPTVAAFNGLPEGDGRQIGVVATPCQALALAKIKTSPVDGYQKSESLRLVIGLFCGWTLAAEPFRKLLNRYAIDPAALSGMDIPAGKNVLALQTLRGITEVPLSEVDACIRTACRYCVDSTAEFADLSVGAARFGDDDEEMRGWNQVVVRSDCGKQLLDLARTKGVLEIREAPARALSELKSAAAQKKKQALKNMVAKSGSKKKLLYLSSDDPVIRKYLE